MVFVKLFLCELCVCHFLLMILGSEVCLVTYTDLFFNYLIGAVPCFKCYDILNLFCHICACVSVHYSSCILYSCNCVLIHLGLG